MKINQIKSLVLLFVASMALSAAALPAGYYAPSSKLASGHWVKVKVSESGIQQITYDQLRAWGFDAPSKVTVHGFGGVYGFDDQINESTVDDLPAQPIVDTGDRILFYGESSSRVAFQYHSLGDSSSTGPVPYIQRNNSADAGYYFVTDGEAKPTSSPIPYIDVTGNNYAFHLSIGAFEENIDNPYKSGRYFFGRDITKNPLSVQLPMTDRTTATNFASNVKLHTMFIGSPSVYNTSMSITYKVDVTSTSSNTYSMSVTDTPSQHNFYYSDKYATYSIGPNVSELSFAVTLPNAANYSYAAIDFAAYCYPRRNIVRDGQLLLTFHSLSRGDVQEVINAKTSYVVWDVSDPAKVRPYVTRYDESTSSMKFTTDRDYSTTEVGGEGFRTIVFDPEATQYAVEFAGEVDNQSLHSNEVPDFIILTSDVCRPQAERLADIHRKQLGQSVLVVGQEEVFNEFSSGTPSPWGIRRMVKSFYDRGYDSEADASKLRAFMLFGGGYFDNIGITSTGRSLIDQGAALLTFQVGDYALVATNTNSYTSDTYYGIVSDCDANPDVKSLPQQVAVGRIPALSGGDAADAVSKVETYLCNRPTIDAFRRPLVVADCGDENGHIENSESVVTTLYDNLAGATVLKGYVSLFEAQGSDGVQVRNYLAQQLKTGTGFFSYSGHGKPDAFSKYNVWTLSANNSNTYSTFPLAVLATCDAYGFDTGATNIASAMVLKKDGGMIGVIAHCRSAYQTYNRIFNEYVAKAYAEAEATTLTGDVYRNGRNELLYLLVANTDRLRNNTLCYNYAGDPALPLYVTSDLATITTINSVDVTDEKARAPITPLGTSRIEGFIGRSDDPSQVDTDFNGTIVVTLYESPITRAIYILEPMSGKTPDNPQDIFTDSDVLTEVTGKVVNGQFTVDFITPLQRRSGDYNRINVYAYNDDYSKTSAGTTNRALVEIYDSLDEAADLVPPVISALYIDDPSFRSGDVVSNEFTVIAEIEPDDSGIRKLSSNIGGVARVTIDNTRSISVPSTGIVTASDGTTRITLPINTIADGRHVLTLQVSDNVGNSASESVEFVVINHPATASLEIDDTTIRTEAEFSLTHTFSGTPTGRFIVEDANGNTVFSQAGCSFPFTWELVDNESNKVADGVYSAYAILNSGLRYATTNRVPVVVIRSAE